MPALLANLESFDSADIEKLTGAGFMSTTDLVDRTPGPAERDALAAGIGVDRTALERLFAMADLMRVSGISEPHAQLLAALDTPTAAALAGREAPVLIKQMRRKNVEILVVRGMPPESTVARWIDDARKLPPLAGA
jgi:hypothetical protein